MAIVSVLIVRAPGTNCEHETAFAWQSVGATTTIMHVNAVRERPAVIADAAIVTIPGGFCYGDDVSAGKILATEMNLFWADALRDFVERGGLVLGVCNGFQVLVKTGLLPGGNIGAKCVTLASNATGRYEDRWVHLAPGTTHCRFIDSHEPIYAPVAHGEGRIVVNDAATLDALRAAGHVAFRYVDDAGQTGDYPVNPNGSADSIAALTDATGQILGLMPHPERNAHLTNHPHWTRLPRDRRPDGLRIFRAAVASIR